MMPIAAKSTTRTIGGPDNNKLIKSTKNNGVTLSPFLIWGRFKVGHLTPTGHDLHRVSYNGWAIQFCSQEAGLGS